MLDPVLPVVLCVRVAGMCAGVRFNQFYIRGAVGRRRRARRQAMTMATAASIRPFEPKVTLEA